MRVTRKLAQLYPEAECALVHDSPLELLIATILSAQCTDARVNIVTKELFQKYRIGRGLRCGAVAAIGKGRKDHRLLSQQGEEHQGLLPTTGR